MWRRWERGRQWGWHRFVVVLVLVVLFLLLLIIIVVFVVQRGPISRLQHESDRQ
jgi:hypothetical protein